MHSLRMNNFSKKVLGVYKKNPLKVYLNKLPDNQRHLEHKNKM